MFARWRSCGHQLSDKFLRQQHRPRRTSAAPPWLSSNQLPKLLHKLLAITA